jgi:electron transfer flavoprotein beta subunit
LEIVVCAKRVPETAEVELKIAEDGISIREDGLVFDINEWDNYALEEALRLREEHGGTVTVVTLGPEAAEEMIRSCVAKGADASVHLVDPAFEGGDAVAVAQALAAAIKRVDYDLILTGTQASDDGWGQVGPLIAHLLGIPTATLVTQLETDEEVVRVRRELEEELQEEVELSLPALIAVQTGINEPRYASVRGIRKALQHEIERTELADLDLPEGAVGSAGSRTMVVKLFHPPRGDRAVMLEGAPAETAAELAGILRSKGVTK